MEWETPELEELSKLLRQEGDELSYQTGRGYCGNGSGDYDDCNFGLATATI